ncbi:hypothetical protein A2630_05055 [Candidatus Woesebacteria bacterium RIFCSPHIGHO2_01_FULL_44_10]|uniref:RNase H type-1 domain-containing protein n=1 Tax=Candidatus Woesebacteria bacterium RIFCSPLOWO2_01_FULL_44_14 TaxID=1802525 RepID=A0A1F8C159_9BACT|nr:MAG: hypothetical protein A2630_05055 [Candidatus Woesebacteria bacterium RIFCSPHIGHO2_01_FULL_44_10]OGM53720.1 MAG: hypothetical protein A3F62_03590 [Candidatus Woesebacteria bacterium RIFCSPHIGHO2_12_FULL_44_11]OGM70067.1 MAG: hypothetical protein A2975_03255 [Candidatus Woesebacteria bacterium RIFCSPLOWO2_01_FULL_44_14]
MPEIKIYCDGGARGNPGPAGIGFVAYQNAKELKRFSKYIGKTTNNIAEYQAVLEALKWLGQREPAIFYLDSELVTRQLTGVYKIRNENLKKLAGQIKRFENKIGSVSYVHVPRSKNKIADSLVNLAIDSSTLKDRASTS